MPKGLKIFFDQNKINIVSASVLRTMDTAADSWSCVVEWTPGEYPEIEKYYQRGSFAPTKVYIDDILLISGKKYITEVVLGNNSQLQLSGYSHTYDMIRSNPPGQTSFLNQSLAEITNQLASPFSLQCKYDSAVESKVNEIFEDQLTIDIQDYIMPWLQDKSRQRGVLLSSDKFGNPYYLKANTSRQPVGTIEENIDGDFANTPGSDTTQEYRIRFDDTQIYQIYQALNTVDLGFAQFVPSGISKDTRIKNYSLINKAITSILDAGANTTSDMARNQALAKSISMPFKTSSWYAPNGELWRENTYITVKGPTIFVPNGFTFLIRAVQYDYDSSGEKATLSLTSPSLFTDGDVEEPWD